MAWLWRAAIGLVLLGSVGCDASGTTESGAAGSAGGGGDGGAGGGGPVCPEEPSLGPVAPECGIWISTSKGNDANSGTQDEPIASLAHAIEVADKGTGRIYACAETWTEALVVPSGVSIHGGFDCENGWAYGGPTMRTMLASSGALATKWVVGTSDRKSIVSDMYIEAADGSQPGESSIAAFATAELPLFFVRCDLVARNAADGADGDDGDPNGMPAMAGTPGNDGANACSGPVSNGGMAPQNVCEEWISVGGTGGMSGPAGADDGADGEPAGPEGQGGLGEQLATSCTGGSPGAAGEDGSPGVGGGNAGRLTVEGFIGYSGEDGLSGKPGQGGGGGGATLGNTASCGATNTAGAAGGSGGAGGCGGRGGRGGQGGGASIAFLYIGGGPFGLIDVNLWAAKGGNGGNGGLPQSGGAGGPGAKGGNSVGSVQPGCAGGNGGKGGQGGYGGGGSGGPSAGASSWGNKSLGTMANVTYHYSTPGQPGAGAPNAPWSWGKPGIDGQHVTLHK